MLRSWVLIVGFAVLGFRLSAEDHTKRVAKSYKSNINEITFDCPILDENHLLINASDCNTANGSIIGLQGKGTGTLVYTWYNVNNKIVGNDPDLMNVPAGQYHVILRDDGKCTAVVTASYTIDELNPIKIDFTSAIIKSPTCNAINGSITDIAITAATKYQWSNSINQSIISTDKDLTNVGPGTYILTASNAKGCIAQARYAINPGDYAPTITSYTTINSGCKASGELHVTFGLKNNSPTYFYVITNSAGNEVNTGSISYNPIDSTRITVQRLAPGNYTFTTSGPSQCFSKILNFSIGEDMYALDLSNLVIHTDICGQALGTILGLGFKGGEAPPVKNAPPGTGNFWFDDKGNRVPQGLTYLAGVPSGWYTYKGINADYCEVDAKFFIPDSVSAASKPLLDDINVCLSGKVGFSVKNIDESARYYLYDNGSIIDSNKTGYFVKYVERKKDFYLSAVNGKCVSPLGKVTINIINPGITIPNTFTPNNDGINDYWAVVGLNQYPGTDVKVFDRTGHLVYRSIDYSNPFNGKLNGSNLPTGTYYYVIDTKRPGCKDGISGYLTIIR